MNAVRSDVDQRKLPIVCHHQGCTPQRLCLEDIKLLLADASQFEVLCTRALLLHVSQTPELERCPAVNCKQVSEEEAKGISGWISQNPKLGLNFGVT